jgi:hypothetical protein
MHDPNDEDLRSLPRYDVSELSARRIRTKAHAELMRAASPKSLGPLKRVYRKMEPILIGAVAASYLFWAVSVVVP